MPTPSAKAALTSNTGHRRSRTVATLPPATPTRASGPVGSRNTRRLGTHRSGRCTLGCRHAARHLVMSAEVEPAPITVRPLAVPELPAVALNRLPEGPVGTDPFWRLVAAFLVAYPDVTPRAYLGDLRAWATWCADRGVHPFTARRHHVDTWVKHLGQEPQPATKRPASPATIARRLSCLSKFYDYGMRDVELIEHSLSLIH